MTEFLTASLAFILDWRWGWSASCVVREMPIA